MFTRSRRFQTFIWNFSSELITFLFSIVAHLTAIFLLNNFTPLLVIRILLNVNFILLVDFNLIFAVSRKQGVLWNLHWLSSYHYYKRND